MKITLADIWFSFSGLQKLNSCPNPPAEKRWIFGTEIFPECEKQFQALSRLNAEIGEKYSVVIGDQRVMPAENQPKADAEWVTLMEREIELPELKILFAELGDHVANLTGAEMKALTWLICKPAAGAKEGDCGCGGKAQVKTAGAV